jgi:hypothetical protein
MRLASFIFVLFMVLNFSGCTAVAVDSLSTPSFPQTNLV